MLRFGLLGVSYNTDALTREEAMSYNAFWNPKVAAGRAISTGTCPASARSRC